MTTQTEAKRDWTPDELAAEVYRRQGFLVMASKEKFPIGELLEVDVVDGYNGRLATPLRVVGLATRWEYLAQEKLTDDLTIRSNDREGLEESYLFYRVEAAD